MKSKEHGRRLMPLLLEVERSLDRDFTLESLAARFGSSSYHFHRVFAGSIGETPKKHVERLRLERAALLLATSDTSILDIGLAVGFKNPETFSRNFKKFLGFTPSGYRRMAKAAQRERVVSVDFHASEAYTLSRARFVSIVPFPLLAVRHLGDYGALNESFAAAENPWSRLIAWANDAGAPITPAPIGLFHDDPTMTPPPLQRADVCIPVSRAVPDADGIRCITFGGGLWAIAEYAGPVDHLLSAFRGLADEIRRSGRFTFRQGPSVEFLRTANVDGRHGIHRIDACFPVARLPRRGNSARIVKKRGAAPR